MNAETSESQATHKQSLAERRFDPAGKRSFIRLIIFALLVFAAVTGWQLYQVVQTQRGIVGGTDVASYQFDLSNFQGDRQLLVPTGRPRDAQQALDEPTILGPTEVEAKLGDRRMGQWGRWLIDSDPVVGVVVQGQPRCYPVRFLNWHEIVNDTVAGVPIAVTYSPIARAAVVFDRRVAERTVSFRYAGLIYNHDLVMYNVTDAEEESLWPQLAFEAISGPAADRGETLEVLPAKMLAWSQWREAYPNTEVMDGLPYLKDRYYGKGTLGRADLYGDEIAAGRPMYPVGPMPGEDSPLPTQATIAAYRDGDVWRVVREPFEDAEAVPSDRPVAYARWFVWHAFHGDETVVPSP